jgi:hypothetical protein
MDSVPSFSEINWISVVAANLVSFAIGSVWYSSVLFGKTWQKELKLGNEEITSSSMSKIFGSAFVLSFIGAAFLDMFIGRESTVWSGMCSGLIVSVAWISTALGVNYLFARKSFKLFLIDAGYLVVFFVVMGAILGAW